MPTARANGVEIAYEIFGVPEGRPLLLIMGLAAQMILWDDDLCAALASRGHRVIRFDNRDVGLSTKCVAASRTWRPPCRRRCSGSGSTRPTRSGTWLPMPLAS